MIFKTWKDGTVSCEDMTHYLLKYNRAACYRKVIQTNFNYLAVPTSPFERLSCDTVADFLEHIKKIVVK
jgi:hypothetical protein